MSFWNRLFHKGTSESNTETIMPMLILSDAPVSQYDRVERTVERTIFSFSKGERHVYSEIKLSRDEYPYDNCYSLDIYNGGIFPTKAFLGNGHISQLVQKLGIVSPSTISHYPMSLISRGAAYFYGSDHIDYEYITLFTSLSGKPSKEQGECEAGFIVFKDETDEEEELRKKVGTIVRSSEKGTILMDKYGKEKFYEIVSIFATLEALYIRRKLRGEDLVYDYQNETLTQLFDLYSVSKERILALIDLVDSMSRIDIDDIDPKLKEEAIIKTKKALDRITIVEDVEDTHHKLKRIVDTKLAERSQKILSEKINNL